MADAYLAAGHRVRIIDSEVAAVVPASLYEANPGAEVIRASVEDYLEGGGTFAGAERVIHAAAHVGPAGILRHAGRLGHSIVAATSGVIERCVIDQVPLVAVSSAEVYGRSGHLAESDPITVPTSYNARIEYAIAKTLTEAMVLNSAGRGLRGLVIRPFNVAGPRQSRAGGFVMPTMVQQALAGRPLTVFLPGSQERCFTAVTDLTGFLLDFSDKAIAAGLDIVNVGNPDNGTTMSDLAARIRHLVNPDAPIVTVSGQSVHGEQYAEAASFRKLPVIDRARSVGWSPSVDLDTMIGQTADYYRTSPDVRGRDAPL